MAVITKQNNKLTLVLFFFLAACMAAAARNNFGNVAVFDICATTDFKETCHRSLAGAAGSQPKDLIKAALDAAALELQSVVKKWAAYITASSDHMTQGALIVCEKMLNTAIDDLRRSSEKVNTIEIGRLSFNIADVRKWLSATVAHKENCVDALESTTSEIGEKVKALLKTWSELLSNGLAVITNTEPHLLGDESHDQEIPPVHVGMAAAAPPKTVTVATHGSGQFKTINGALNNLSQNSNDSVVVFVKAGTYYEYVRVPKGMNNVALIGEGPLKTIISGNRSNATGYPTPDTATLAVEGDGFLAKDIKIENTAPTTQAVAVRTDGDKAVFHNVHFESLQDTLYAQTYHQFYRDCRISGTVDFIFGDAVAVFQNCEIVVRKPLPGQECTITAQGRQDKNGDGVTVIQGCRITAEHALRYAQPPVLSYLGRPWKEYSRTIIMQSFIGHFISPEGWLAWENSNLGFGTLYYGEYCNDGARAGLGKRVGWEYPKNLTAEMAQSFTAEKVFVNDEWVKKSGVPYVGGLLPNIIPCSTSLI